jgi:hypothetical protein
MTRQSWWPRVRGWTFGLVVPALIWAPIVAVFGPAPHTVPTCRTEDSSACAWHGGTNRTGRTFTTTSDGAVTYSDGSRVEPTVRERLAR